VEGLGLSILEIATFSAFAIVPSIGLTSTLGVSLRVALGGSLSQFCNPFRSLFGKSAYSISTARAAYFLPVGGNVNIVNCFRMTVSAMCGRWRFWSFAPLGSTVPVFGFAVATATGKANPSPAFIYNNITSRQRVSPLAMGFSSVHASAVFRAANKLKVTGVAARSAATKMIYGASLWVYRQRMNDPRKHQTVKAYLWPVETGATIPVFITVSKPDPARDAVILNVRRNTYLGKESSEIFLSNRTNGKIRVRHSRNFLSAVFRAIGMT
jgi:hypothetical protein